jgi:tetratricopeptide repeat protein 30
MMMTHPSTIPDGKYTLTVYTLIKDGRFQDVIRLMKNELGLQPRNRAGLSLLAYSYYQIQEFALAADTYEKLSKFYPDIHEYRLYYAQALYKSAQYQAAQKACHSIAEAQEFGPKVRLLKLIFDKAKSRFLSPDLYSIPF